jgi:hypothetical protein
MADFVSSHGEFRGWKNQSERRRNFLDELIRCIKKYTNKGFGATVVLSDYRRIDKQYRVHERLGSPYALCGWSCIEHVMRWSSRQGVERVVFMFEDGDRNKGDLQRICRERLKVEPLFYGKRDFIPFQAADLAAWKTRNPLSEAIRRDDLTNEEAERLLTSLADFTRTAHTSKGFEYEGLLQLCEDARIPRR